MSNEQQIGLYETGIHPCSYIPGKDAATQFLDPRLRIGADIAEQLAQLGFRRSGEHTYRPHCPGCNACIPLRVRVQDFQPNRTQRKVLNRNQDVGLEITEPAVTLEYYRLYRRYINQRHQDGDMFPPTAKQYADFLAVDSGYTKFWEFREKDQLLGIAVTDHFQEALSAVYSYYIPDQAYSRRSLGVYFVLRQIMAAKDLGYPYLYLGYLIRECRKMSYKTDFPPLEQLVGHQWQNL
ncbi:arginyltransferase [Parendozoicomonas sp. Alg238-R29]|uniref:arginyltransferase n=1 Tax=Parendozoicomonas sp. Alg238-R29 TaxID=2993446 RepID=UPI00248EA30E|nr:arginyltransferase [Parendozoicomonas sp. Alg238-R29]